MGDNMFRIAVSTIVLGAALYMSAPTYAMPNAAFSSDIVFQKKCPHVIGCGFKICPPIPVPGRECIVLNADIRHETY